MIRGWISRRWMILPSYFYEVRRKYAEFESPVNNQIKTDVLISQIPGGMLSNLVAQLRQQNAEDKLDAVLARNASRAEGLGISASSDADEPDLRLPGGAQCHDGKTLFRRGDGDKNYVMGLYGEPPGPISDEIKNKVLGKKQPITCRPADLLKPGLDQARKEIDGLVTSEEDVLSYALFPEIARDYFLSRDGRKTEA